MGAKEESGNVPPKPGDTTPMFGEGRVDEANTVLGPKPSDHPDYYRLPPPPGRSRESSIRLDALGRFFHDGHAMDHAKLANAFHAWIRRHPESNRFILDNGYDWTYFQVDDTPLFVRGVSDEGLTLLGGRTVPWTSVHRLGRRREDVYADLSLDDLGRFPARFLQDGRLALGQLLVEESGSLGLFVGPRFIPVEDAFSS